MASGWIITAQTNVEPELQPLITTYPKISLLLFPQTFPSGPPLGRSGSWPPQLLAVGEAFAATPKGQQHLHSGGLKEEEAESFSS